MTELFQIPMFPLTMLPLPGELIALHIFEPRYKQLLADAETLDISFGIFCNHTLNKGKMGALMKLHRVVKRYANGEADILVSCTDTFSMDRLYNTYKARLYPGGDVQLRHINLKALPGVELHELFVIYQTKRDAASDFTGVTIYDIARELNLDLFNRYKFLMISAEGKEPFLINQLKFQIHIIRQEEKSKGVFHLN